jgi:hypothetical protein
MFEGEFAGDLKLMKEMGLPVSFAVKSSELVCIHYLTRL